MVTRSTSTLHCNVAGKGKSKKWKPRAAWHEIASRRFPTNDQNAAVHIETTDGKTVIGRIVNLSNDVIIVNTNMEEPNTMTTVKRSKIETMATSKLSMMPTGLIDSLKEDEIADLVAFLLSRGDRKNKMFR